MLSDQNEFRNTHCLPDIEKNSRLGLRKFEKSNVWNDSFVVISIRLNKMKHV